MSQLAWLHLSDWHQRGPDFDRTVIRDALIKEIRERERIDPALARIDFVAFSGDLAFSGTANEYEAARQHLLDPILAALGLDPSRLFIVPGNHDLNRDTVSELLGPELQKPLNTDALVQKWLDGQRRTHTLQPFDAYRKFVSAYTGQPTPDYGSVVTLDVAGRRVALLGLNSAWMTARNKDAKGQINDYGYAVIGEPQLHGALASLADADVRIAVVHHPFEWLSEFDRQRVEGRLGRECHFILRGHVHNPQVQVMRGTEGDCVVIPAGAAYERRLADNPRYTNAYNWVRLDLDAGQGVVYLRRWSDRRNEWVEDTDAHPHGKVIVADLPKGLGRVAPAVAPAATPETAAPASHTLFERAVLEGYLNALIGTNTDLDSGGIKQTKVQVVLPLDEIYVSLQADRDRPDVDRRVMQEELDEITKALEREDDPQKRERQYQIWASQARTLQQALELAGPREELANIVQRHRQVVVLGDPGSGKTTLVRYLTLRLARAVLADPERIFQPQELWDGERAWRLPGLGPVRLPILVRISHYAEARQKDPDLPLVAYLPRYFAGLSVPHADDLGRLLQRLLQEGRCMVMLDGLDEIIDPTDRRNIAAAIGQFAAVYREMGLPDWLTRSLTSAPARSDGTATASEDEDDLVIQWDKNVPEDVRQEWGRQIRQRHKGWRRRGRAARLAWELLDQARSAHVGNRFVVTSRIAGYHFGGVPGEFEHYTIRRMSPDDIRLFLEKWCPAVERRIAVDPDPVQVEQRARREIDGILHAVETTSGVRRMAENPLLLRILAIIHRNEAHLPQRRVELYETACVTLLRDWHLERGTKGVAIDDVKATSLLGPLAFHIHENRASGFLSKGETERILAGILARERGEKDPEQPSLETREAVREFLDTVRQHSGLFVERGEGLYGFMHLTFEEYFTARQLISRSGRARAQILERLHLPRWREPILLAVGALSKQFYEDTDELLRAILDAGSPNERVLHRDLLFAAACVGDSVNVAPVLRQDIARRLLTLYCDRHHAGRYRRLRQQLKDAVLTLCNDDGSAAVELALAEIISTCPDRMALECALDVVEWLGARTTAVARALAIHAEAGELPRIHDLLRAVESRLPATNAASRPTAGWDQVRNHPDLPRLLGAMRWSKFLRSGLGIDADAFRRADAELDSLSLLRVAGTGNAVLRWFREVPEEQRDVRFWEGVATPLRETWQAAPLSSPLEVVAGLLIQEVVHVTTQNATPLPEHLMRIWATLRRGSSRKDVARTPMSSLAEALTRFESVVREAEVALADISWDRVFELSGTHLLAHVSANYTAAATFATIAGQFAAVPNGLDENSVRSRVSAVQRDLGRALLTLLRSSANGQQYQDAAYCLFPEMSLRERFAELRAESDPLITEATGIISADLNGSDETRRRWALQALISPPIRGHLPLIEINRGALLERLDGALGESTLVIDILFARGLRPDVLRRCWSLLRQPGHPLASTIREHLDALTTVSGDAPMLALLNEGLSDQAVRASALELLRKVKWQDVETFTPALTLMLSAVPDVRHLGALLLSQQKDVFDAPRSVLALAAKDGIRDTGRSWETRREDPRLLRLLGALWIHGWDEALVQLWVRRPARAYVDGNHPVKNWRDFRTFPESEQCIHWLLGEAWFGQSMLPVFDAAAARLAEIEGEVEGAPRPDHLATVQREIGHEIEVLATRPGIAHLLRAETAVLSAAIRGETASPMSTNALHDALLSMEDGETWLVLALVAGTDELSAVRASCASGSTAPLARWLHHALAKHALTAESSPGELARLLTAHASDARAAAALALLTVDLPDLLIRALIEAAQSPDDRVRTNARTSLYNAASILHTDGSTAAPRTLLRSIQNALAIKDGYLGTISVTAVASVDHSHPFWVNRWIEQSEAGRGDESGSSGLGTVSVVSDEVLSVLCATLTDAARPLAARRAIIDALDRIQRTKAHRRSDVTIHNALVSTLADTDTELRRGAAEVLQWADGKEARSVVGPLLRAAQDDADVRTRTLSLRSLGQVLRTVRDSLTVDASKEALLGWLASEIKEGGRFFSPFEPVIVEAMEGLRSLPGLEAMPDVESVLEALAHPETLGTSPQMAMSLRNSTRWLALVDSATQEWTDRRSRLRALPELAPLTAQVQALIAAPHAAVRRTAAGALARLYHGDADRPARLGDLLPDDTSVLVALMDAGTDRYYWDYEGESGYHQSAVKQIVGWIESKPPEERAILMDTLMRNLDTAITGPGKGKYDEVAADVFGWPAARIHIAVLAELSERLTYRAFTRKRELADVVALFARTAAYPFDFNTRSFAIRVLGNLQQLTDEVAAVFFAACQDVEQVVRETRMAVTKFKTFGVGSLERLTGAIQNPSITVAYHAALLLGELGFNRSEDLGHEGRQRVVHELVQLLDQPIAERTIYDFSQSEDGRRIGPLYDEIYEALVRVVAGPDTVAISQESTAIQEPSR